MSREYRILELTTPVNTFTPQYRDDGGPWNNISQATSLTRAGAEQAIDSFISSGNNVNEIYHPYNPSKIKPLFDGTTNRY